MFSILPTHRKKTASLSVFWEKKQPSACLPLLLFCPVKMSTRTRSSPKLLHDVVHGEGSLSYRREVTACILVRRAAELGRAEISALYDSVAS